MTVEGYRIVEPDPTFVPLPKTVWRPGLGQYAFHPASRDFFARRLRLTRMFASENGLRETR